MSPKLFDRVGEVRELDVVGAAVLSILTMIRCPFVTVNVWV